MLKAYLTGIVTEIIGTMTFDELWKEIKNSKVLPSTAIAQIPDAISEKTKKSLTKLTPQEVAQIINNTIDEINHGSVKTVDTLIREKSDSRYR